MSEKKHRFMLMGTESMSAEYSATRCGANTIKQARGLRKRMKMELKEANKLQA